MVGIKTRVCIINAGVLTKANTAKVRIANAGYSNVTRIGGGTNTASDSIAKARMRVVSNTIARIIDFTISIGTASTMMRNNRGL